MAAAGPSTISSGLAAPPASSPSLPSPATAPGGGPAPLVTIRTKAPLPLFNCPHPIPPSSSTVGATLKLSVLRLLTGEVSQQSSTAPMTESENLKLMTIHGWRMEMIALELRQNVLIAPETRERIGEGVDDEMEGFELADDAECGLLEPGDEVLVRLKPAFSFADLHLPSMAKGHVYALPPGSLTRAGTLSNPPPYSQVTIKRPAEPSSHSSSVQGHPEVNYERQHRNYSKGYRVVTVPSQGATATQVPQQHTFGATGADIRRNRASNNPAVAGPSRPLGLGMGVEPPAAMPAATTYRPPGLKQRRSSSNQKDKPSRDRDLPQLPSPSPMGTPVGTTNSPAPGSSNAFPFSPPSSSRPSATRTPTSQTFGSAHERRTSGTSVSANATVSKQNFGTGKPAGQDSMPLTALVIGPGVQGAVGRGSNAAMGHTGPAQGDGVSTMESIAEYGNAKAFASFTAAGGEVKHRSKKRTSSHSSNKDKEEGKERRRSHTRTKSQELLASTAALAGANGGRTVDPSSTGDKPRDPSRAAVEAAEKRAAAARAALAAGLEPSPTSSADDSPSSASPPMEGALPLPKEAKEKDRSKRSEKERRPSQKSKRERVELPEPPVLPAITNLAPFPESDGRTAEKKESDLPPMPMPVPISKPNADGAQRSRERTLSRNQSFPAGGTGNGNGSHEHGDSARPRSGGGAGAGPSSAAAAAALGEACRPQANRHASSGAVTSGSVDSAKKPGRFSRLAAPGLGLGGPPAVRSVPLLGKRSNSSKAKRTEEEDGPALPVDGSGSGAPAENRTPVYTRFTSNGGMSPAHDLAAEDIDPDLAAAAAAAAAAAEEDRASPEPAPAPELTRAERRYASFQRAAAAEKERQGAAERVRLAEIEERAREREREARRREVESMERKERERWEVWEEVRRRGEAEREREKERERERGREKTKGGAGEGAGT